jgi:hypothetical protein
VTEEISGLIERVAAAIHPPRKLSQYEAEARVPATMSVIARFLSALRKVALTQGLLTLQVH